MRKIIEYIAYITLASTMAIACKRQHIHSQDLLINEATVWVDIDWSESGISQDNISNISVYAYPEDGSAPYLKISGNTSEAYINLPVGIYSLLIMNGTVDDISEVEFSAMDSFGTALAKAAQWSSSEDIYYEVQSDEVVTLDMGEIAIGTLTSIEITDEMISCGYCDKEESSIEVRYEVTPEILTRECIVTLRIENLDNAYIVEGVIKGFASGAYLWSADRYSDSSPTTLYAVELTQKSYDDDSVDGTITGECITFGKSGDEVTEYEIVIDVILNSGERTSYTRDITSLLSEQEGTTIFINLTDIEYQISLPEYTGTGFGVEDWSSNSPIELL